jgi:hypothetical protein
VQVAFLIAAGIALFATLVALVALPRGKTEPVRSSAATTRETLA